MEGYQVIIIIIDYLDHLHFLDEEHHLVEGCHLDLDNVLYLIDVLYGLLQSQSTDDNSDNLLTVGHNLIMNNRSLDVAISIHR